MGVAGVDDYPKPRHARGRIVMLVDTPVRGDSRVQKEALAAAQAGWEVFLLGSTKEAAEERWRIGAVEVRLLPRVGVLDRRRFDFRRSWRHPLAYPPSGIADYHRRRVEAWVADLRTRWAELDAIERPEAASPVRSRRLALLAEGLAASVRRLWVRLRAHELWRARRARQRLAGPWDRFVTWFWLAAMGDRGWRRLEPRLWEWELTFGKVVDQLRPDVIHANDFFMLPVGARAKLRARAAGRQVRLVWDAHELLSGIQPRSNDLRWARAHRAYEREYSRYADATITVSAALADELQRAHRLPERPSVVLNTPDVSGQRTGPAPSLREVCGLGPGTPLLVYSGGSIPRRGIDVMVEALPRMPGVHVAFVIRQPPSKYVEGLVERAVSLGVGSRVHLAPYVAPDQVVEYLSSADAGVIPIHHWPNHEIALITKFFEYAHARLPMIISDVRTMAQVTLELGQGEVFRAKNVEDYARAANLVLADPARYRAAYDRPGVLESWTWRSQAEILNAIYARFAPSHPRRVPGEAPDVSVILPVRTGSLGISQTVRRLLDQTLGPDCLQVIVVDEASGSGERLDELAAENPGTLRVIHHAPDPHRPAAASNIGLDVARGRYIMFVAVGDRLGPGTLERMVTAADHYDCGVLAAGAVSVDGRPGTAPPSVGTDADAGPFAPEVTAAGLGTKLFRRRLLEEHGLRFDEDLRFGSDRLFTLRSCLRARRVSVVHDQDCDFALVEPATGPAGEPEPELRDIERVVDVIAQLVPAGSGRDSVLRPIFSFDLPNLLNDGLPALPRPEQDELRARVGRLAEGFMSDDLAAGLAAAHRVRLRLAQLGRTDELLEVIGQDADPRPVPIRHTGGECYLGYACFGSSILPDEVFRITHDLAGLLAARIEVRSLTWRREAPGPVALVARATCSPELAQHGESALAVGVGDVLASVRLERRGPAASWLEITVPAAELATATASTVDPLLATVTVRLPGSTGDRALAVARGVRVARHRVRSDGRDYRLSARRGRMGTLVVDRAPRASRRRLDGLARTMRLSG